MAIVFYANASVVYGPSLSRKWDDHGWISSLKGYTLEVYKYSNAAAISMAVHFRDPTEDIIFAFDNYLLRGAAVAASCYVGPEFEERYDEGISVNQTIVAQTLPIVFHTDLRRYAAAAVVELVTILLILPMFWGFWTLGCDLTLSPLNLAPTFDSPLVRHVDSTTGAKGVVEELGAVNVKFGAVEPLRTANTPRNHSDDRPMSERLGIAPNANVINPWRGVRFRK